MNPKKLFFTSDTHYGHEAAIGFCNRPAANAAQMDQVLIDRWNEVVPKDGTVFHLGDVTFHKEPSATVRILEQLNGFIHLVEGNHDRKMHPAVKAMFQSIQPYHEFRLEGEHLVLCHFPFRSWNGMHRGSWNLHGHCHGSMFGQGKQLDVGVDGHVAVYAPISFEHVRTHMYPRAFVQVDHHKPKDPTLTEKVSAADLAGNETTEIRTTELRANWLSRR